ncbi:TPA: hypothetical protein N0F65_003463 [Lagenidium giganteum]|uniref:Rab-GAP TBC domain-containing protein n=1 Tax=Lagenidium giganteum TaxID=4803 RepID=A0AAV2YPE6_9STRA|nr:TPA: hypothetical protein N0F65_003463 [Lagenidium giganteum]
MGRRHHSRTLDAEQDPIATEKRDSVLGGPGWGSSALEKMKDRATMAKNHMSPQIQKMRDNTSKRLEKYQPSIDRVKSSASAAAERMQPALSRVKEGSSQGWSILRNRLPNTAPIADKIHTMGMHVVSDILGDSAVEVVFVDDPAAASAMFVEMYKPHANDARTLGSRMPTLIRSISNRSNASSRSNSTTGASPAEQCFANRYILSKILVFGGSMQILGNMLAVNQACRGFIIGEKRLWRFCVRYGPMPQSIRFNFWEHVAGVQAVREASELDFDTYLQMAISKGGSTELIMTDVRRTYGRVAPHKRSENEEIVDVEKELINQLSDILHALSGRFPDVGYCQGMDYIAAHVLDHVKRSSEARISAGSESPTRSTNAAATRIEVERAFWILVSLFENYGLRQMFSPGLQKLHLHCYQFQRLFELGFPTLSDHFDDEKVMAEMFIVGWFQTLFLYLNVLPRETLDRIWDIFLVENNWKIMQRVSLALLQQSEPFIVSRPIDEMMQFLNTFGNKSKELLAADVLIPKALSIKVTNTVLTKLQKQHNRRPDQRRKSVSRQSVSAIEPTLNGQSLWVRDYLQYVRNKSRIAFLVLRQGIHSLQAILRESGDAPHAMVDFSKLIPKESVVDVFATVSLPDKPVRCATQKDVELDVHKLFMVSKVVAALPFQMEDASRPDVLHTKDSNFVNFDLQTPLNVRAPVNQAIVRIQARFGRFFREFLESRNFVEIHTPRLTAGATESGL